MISVSSSQRCTCGILQANHNKLCVYCVKHRASTTRRIWPSVQTADMSTNGRSSWLLSTVPDTSEPGTTMRNTTGHLASWKFPNIHGFPKGCSKTHHTCRFWCTCAHHSRDDAGTMWPTARPRLPIPRRQKVRSTSRLVT